MSKRKEWGIEFGISEGSFDAPVYCWYTWSKYTSQRRMFQALSDFRKQKISSKRCTVDRDGNTVNCVDLFFHYRPVHVNCDF